jgi:hypothetical protein
MILPKKQHKLPLKKMLSSTVLLIYEEEFAFVKPLIGVQTVKVSYTYVLMKAQFQSSMSMFNKDLYLTETFKYPKAGEKCNCFLALV